MRSKVAILSLLFVSACAGDEVDPSNYCTKALYDTCATEHDCTTGECRFFMAEDFAACTQACDASTPCPDGPDGQPATCETNGFCKPAAPNECLLVVE